MKSEDGKVVQCECGSDAEIESFSDCVVVRCGSGGCVINEVVTSGTEEEAIEEWNLIMNEL